MSVRTYLIWAMITFGVFLAVIWIGEAPTRAPGRSWSRRFFRALAGAAGLEVVMFYLNYGGLSALHYDRYSWVQFINWVIVFAWTLFALVAYIFATRNKARAIPLVASVIAAGLVFLVASLPLELVRNLMRLTVGVSLVWWVIGWRSREGPGV